MSEDNLVIPGYRIELELVDELGAREPLTVQIVPDAYADLGRGYLGESTPLCQAIYGHVVGTEVEYRMGDIRAVRILALFPADAGPDPAVKQRRDETLKRAVDQANLTDAILFASSFNGKWGDYDPSGLIDELEKDHSPDES